ncbi:MAG: hypothetical protein IJC88_04875 [Oscillospiraceae bacterium]|nr:hypothetical protein [Oscillospiraceae bacterium]
MKKIILIAVAAVLLIALLVPYVPYYFHGCDSCDKFFVGPGYEANVVVDLFSKGEQLVCRECAESQHVVGTTFGKDIAEYRRSAIVDPITAYGLLFK